MQFEARIAPLEGKLPKVSYRWDPETDILSVACKGVSKATGMNVHGGAVGRATQPYMKFPYWGTFTDTYGHSTEHLRGL